MIVGIEKIDSNGDSALNQLQLCRPNALFGFIARLS